MSKMPKVLESFKFPLPLSKIFVQKQYVSKRNVAESIIKKPMVLLRNKLQFNLGKFVNSDHIYGRTNVII